MNMKGCTKLFLSLGACFALSACDIGPSGLSSGFEEAARNYQSSSSSSQPQTITVNGTVAKGLILNGTVNIHPIVSGIVSETPMATGVTDSEDGSYSVEVNNYFSTPLVVRVQTNDDTQMICDLPSGCGDDIDFGSTYDFHDTNFSLDALSPVISSTSVNINTSSLTHTAASVALSEIGPNSADVSELIRQANTRVANRFGLTGSVTELPIIDITQPTNLINRTRSQIEYNLINSAVVQSTITNNPALSISQAIDSFATQYSSAGGIADTESTASPTVTLAEILSQANNTITRIQEADTGNVVDLGNIRSVIQASQQLAESGSTEPTDGEVDETGDLDELGKVKAMVAEVRKLGTAIESGFDQQATMIENALDQDAGHVLAALSMGMDAIGGAIEAYDLDDTIEQYQHADTGLTVNIVSADPIVTYTIDDTVMHEGQEVALALNAADAGSTVTTGTEGDTESATADVELSLNGDVSSDWVSMEITSGSVVLTNFAGSVTETVDGDTTTEVIDAAFDTANFDLNVVLEEGASATDPVSFTGQLGFSISGAELSETATETMVDGQWMEQFVSSADAESLNVYLNGTFANTSGNLVNASVSLNSALVDYDPNVEETELDYVDVNFSIILRVPNLGEIASPVTATLTGSRSGLDDAEIDLQVRYGAVTLDSSHDTSTATEETETLVVTDQNGVTLTLIETADVVSGNITLNGTQYATISMVNTIPTVSYTDGTNESLW